MSPYRKFRFNGLRWTVTRTSAKTLPSGALPVIKRRWRCALPLLIIYCLFAANAQADSFAFSGTAMIGGDFANFFFSGPNIGIHSAFPSFSDRLGGCAQNAPCPLLSQSIPAASQFGRGFSGGSIDGSLNADVLIGSLNFTGTALIPLLGSGQTFDVSAPVTFVGHLLGYQIPLGSLSPVGPAVFSIDVSGQGTGTLSGFALDESAVICCARYSYSGTAIVTPEPSTLVLLAGLGLIVFGYAAGRRLFGR